MKARRFYVIAGGTMVHVAPHFSLCAPAYGRVGKQIAQGLHAEFVKPLNLRDLNAPKREARLREALEYNEIPEVVLVRTKMALGDQEPSSAEKALYRSAEINRLETNEDLEKLLDYLVSCSTTKGIVLAAAVCDWDPVSLHREVTDQWDEISQGVRTHTVTTGTTSFGKRVPRLQTSEGDKLLRLRAADKLIGRIRKARKDIFLVGFKATTGLPAQEQYIRGLRLLKNASCNLVLSNDVHEHRNMVITPEEAKYHVTKDRREAVKGLCEMIAMRSQLHFTRSTVIDGDPIPWDSEAIPENLRKVVNHLIARGAYKPFQGKTVGHFATRGPKNGIIYTSRRKTNFNNLPEDGLLRIDAVGDDMVIAHGAKPSVGGQSQRIIFDEHSDVDCIVHAHVPLRKSQKVTVSLSSGPVSVSVPRRGLNAANLPVRAQRPYECGSHECGRNTSEGLREVWNGIKAVMLDEHGPNICFSKDVDPDRVIEFIEDFWDLEAKTGGPVSLEGVEG